MSTRFFKQSVLFGGLIIGLACGSVVAAPANGGSRDASANDRYSQPAPAAAVEPIQIIQAKAMTRAKARADRMAARDWYGYVPSRPRAISTPLVGAGAFGRTPAYYQPRRPLLYFYR